MLEKFHLQRGAALKKIAEQRFTKLSITLYRKFLKS
jgi:hypothetical protein